MPWLIRSMTVAEFLADVCRGHKINYSVTGSGKPLILVHGFGKPSTHTRISCNLESELVT